MTNKRNYRKREDKKEYNTAMNKNIDMVKNNLPFWMESKRLEYSFKLTKGKRILKKGEFNQLIADNIGISKSGVEQMIKGLSLPSIITALKLSDFLDIPVNKLFELNKDEINKNKKEGN